MAFRASLHLAAFVMWAGLGAVLVTQVDLDAGEVVLVAFERAFKRAANPLVEPDVAFDVIAAVDRICMIQSLFSLLARDAPRPLRPLEFLRLLTLKSANGETKSSPFRK